MRRFIRWALAGILVAVVGIQFFRPARTNPGTDPANALASHVAITPGAASVLERACRDCHSNDTRWPWYSAVAPVSWFVADHVNHGRSHFNYSNWAQYDRDDARRLLKNVCAFARDRTMPMASYTWLHPEARLSKADIEALCEWSEAAELHHEATKPRRPRAARRKRADSDAELVAW